MILMESQVKLCWKPIRVPTFTSKYLKANLKALAFLNQQRLSPPQLTQMQSHLIVSGAISDPSLFQKFITLFTTSEGTSISHAYALFRLLPRHSTSVYNTMIRAFTESHLPQDALFLSTQMVKSSHLPNNYTFSFVFRACCELCDVSLGSMYHTLVVKLGWEFYDFVQNGLIHLYASNNCMDHARKLFEASTFCDVITWTALVNGYLKSGELGLARELFDQMPEKNTVSWSALINGYSRMGLFKEALELFSDMQAAGVRPNHAGVVGALSACASLGALDQGRWIHAYVERSKMKLDKILGTALMDMYAKCGCIEMACRVFEDIPSKDILAYTSLISGLADHGEGAKVLEVFERMKREGVRPNEVTFISVLSACSRVGLVEEGLKIFESMKTAHGIEPGVEHYGCLVDLLGRAGRLEQAKDVVRKMPMEADDCVVGALLGACRVHGDNEFITEMVKWLDDLIPQHSGVHFLLSNTHATLAQWGDVEKVRKRMRDEQVEKVPGCSSIEVDGVVSEFVARDRSHLLYGDWKGT